MESKEDINTDMNTVAVAEPKTSSVPKPRTSRKKQDTTATIPRRTRSSSKKNSLESSSAAPPPPPAPVALPSSSAKIEWFEEEKKSQPQCIDVPDDDENTVEEGEGIRRPDAFVRDCLLSPSSSSNLNPNLNGNNYYYDHRASEEEEFMRRAMEESRRLFNEDRKRRQDKNQRVLQRFKDAQLDPQQIEKRLSWYIRFPPPHPIDTNLPSVSIFERLLRIFRYYHSVSKEFPEGNFPDPPEDFDLESETQQARISLFELTRPRSSSPPLLHPIPPEITRFLEFLDSIH